MPTIAALVVMLSLVGIGVIVSGATTLALIVAGLLSVGGIIMGMRGWADSGGPKSLRGWLRTAAIYACAGLAIYAGECVFGKLLHPELAFFEAGIRTGPFGGACTVVVTGWLVLFSIGGAVRRGTESWMQRRANESQ